MDRKPFNMRAMTAFMVTAAFVFCVVTGVVLFAVPQGRIANWVDWRLLGLLKEEWAQVHLVFGLLFLVFGVFHLIPYNWPTFKAYLAARRQGRLDFRRPRRELLAGLAVSLLLAAGSIAAVPPFSHLFDFNAWVRDAWVTGPEYQPPFGHAEELSLASFAKRMNMDLEAATAALKARGLAFGGTQESLSRIAKANGMSAMDLYMLIKPFERTVEAMPPAARYTPEMVEERFEGKGIGRKTVAEMVTETGVDPAAVAARLLKAGIAAANGRTLKELADAHQMTPVDVLKVMLVADDKGV
jgi:hypothetical protein